MKHRIIVELVCCALSATTASAQENNKVTFSGSIQSDMMLPQTDNKIGAEKKEDFLTNTYIDLRAQHKYFEAGARLEYMEHPLPGFENDFKGWGVPHFYVKGKLEKAELTLGTFYEQFGSGFILRTYEERSLGIDNSLLGGRLVVKPAKGVTLKALGGKQRRYWEWNKAFISGADAELSLDEWIPSMQQHDTRLSLGFSWVNKHENPDEDITTTRIYPLPNGYSIVTLKVQQPRYVNAWDARVNLNHGAWNVLAEYAQKTADPSYDNGYIYRKGNTAMLSTSYSKKGLSVLLQAKRSENMASRSQRKMKLTSSFINHLPAFTQDHTYALAALYPYATQLADGEWAYQAEVGYNFKRKTPLGGKYGMNLKVNYSYVRAIDRQWEQGLDLVSLSNSNMQLAGKEGYHSKFFKWGDQTYYQDLNVQLSRKFSKAFKLNLMYMNQRYNKTVIEGEGGMIHSDIYVADGKYQFSPKTTLRAEAQYLCTRQDLKDWAFGLLELSLVPHWMFTVSDMWNCGGAETHYYQGSVTFNTGAHRMQLGYGRTRAGYNCSGGVCRWIPASKGFTLSYNYNF
ncbi:MAG: hypothetical protein IJS97_02990 [Prevotella sp.]|nr:hypothetical protein [Prevotella sp.]